MWDLMPFFFSFFSYYLFSSFSQSLYRYISSDFLVATHVGNIQIANGNTNPSFVFYRKQAPNLFELPKIISNVC